MALFDALSQGAGFIDQLRKGRILDAQAKYAEPMEAGNLFKLQTENQYLPDKLRLANQYQGLINQYYGPQAQAGISATNASTARQLIENRTLPERNRLELEHQGLINQFYPELTRAQINSYNNRGMGLGGVGQREIANFQRQLMQEHQDWDANTANQAASAYLNNDTNLPSGEELPPLSGLAQSYVAQIRKRNSTAAVQNQAANMGVLADDVNKIDIGPVQRFSGLPGRFDVARYTADMAAGQPVPQEFRDYLAFKDITSNFAMDALRKGFGTSVVPPYVYATLGKAANPGSTWWNDPKQVETNWNATKKWINENSKNYADRANKGVTYREQKSEHKEPTSKKITKRWKLDANGKLVEA